MRLSITRYCYGNCCHGKTCEPRQNILTFIPTAAPNQLLVVCNEDTFLKLVVHQLEGV